MEMSPQTIRSTGFKTVRKGYDPTEVDEFKEQTAAAVEFSQNLATAMEARARAAFAKLQEVTQQVASAGREERSEGGSSGDSEIISRTLLLAQRAADATLADARVEAEQITSQAREEAAQVVENAVATANKAVDDARADARRASDEEATRAENEVQALLARRDFLLADVDHLEQYVQAQRERLRDAAVQLHELVDRVPGGLGEMRRPLLSASADSLPEHSPEVLPEVLPEPEQASALDLDPEPEPDSDSDPHSLFMPSLKSDAASRAPDDDTDQQPGLVFGEEPQ